MGSQSEGYSIYVYVRGGEHDDWWGRSFSEGLKQREELTGNKRVTEIEQQVRVKGVHIG